MVSGGWGTPEEEASGVLRPSDMSALERGEQASQASWGPGGVQMRVPLWLLEANLSELLTAPLRLYLGPGAGKRPLNRG